MKRKRFGALWVAAALAVIGVNGAVVTASAAPETVATFRMGYSPFPVDVSPSDATARAAGTPALPQADLVDSPEKLAKSMQEHGKPVYSEVDSTPQLRQQRPSPALDANGSASTTGVHTNAAAIGSFDACRGAAVPGDEYGSPLDRNTWCLVAYGAADWWEGTNHVGWLRFRQTTAGYSENTRTINVQSQFDQFEWGGRLNGNTEVGVRVLVPEISDPATCQTFGASPFYMTASQWSSPNAWAGYDVRCDGGVFMDQRAMGYIALEADVRFPGGGWKPGPRLYATWDSAPYLPGSQGGAKWTYVLPVFLHSYTAQYAAVSRHIGDYYLANPTAPGDFRPYLNSGQIPPALFRNQESFDEAARQVTLRNNNAQARECAKLTQPPGGYQCDEFPFNSTANGGGADQPFSVRYIPTWDNSQGGYHLANKFGEYRTLHMESFWVLTVA